MMNLIFFLIRFPDDSSLAESEPTKPGVETQQHQANRLSLLPVLPGSRHCGSLTQQPPLDTGEDLRGAADPDQPRPEP